MTPSQSHMCRKSGFTLLELAIVLAIIGLVAMAGIVVLVSSIDRRQYAETNAKLEAIEKALLEYRRAFNRLPCPGDITLGIAAADFGVEGATAGTCTGGAPAANFTSGEAVAGMVPVKTLRLPDDYALDGWGDRIFYAIDRRATGTNAFTTYDITSALGAIQVNDQTGAARTATAVYALFSMSQDGHGAWRRGGSATRQDKDITNAETLENCDCDADGADTGFNAVFVQRPYTLNSADALDRFDDIVLFKARRDLRNFNE